MWSKHPDLVAAWLLVLLLLVAVGTAPLSKIGTEPLRIIDVATQRYDTKLPSAANAPQRTGTYPGVHDEHDEFGSYLSWQD